METIAIKGLEFLAWQSIQIGIVAVLAGLVCIALRRSSAHIRYLVWIVVLAKCFVPGIVPVPVAILPSGPGVSGPDSVSNGDAAIDAQSAPAAWQTRITLGELPPAPATPSLWRTITPAGWMAMGWIMGVTFFLGYAGVKAIRLEWQLRSNRKPVTGDLAGIVEEMAARFRTKCRVFVVPGIGQPFVWGLWRGTIYLPADFERSADFRNYYKVLAHEFAHVARFDPLINAVQVVAQAVFFFHPLVWIMNRRLRMEREKCCDETAIALLDTSPREYGAGIVQVLMHECRRDSATPTLAVGGSVRTIEERIRTILRPGRRFRAGISPLAAVCVIVFAMFVLPTGLVVADKDQPAAATAVAATPRSVEAATDIEVPAAPESRDPFLQPSSTENAVVETTPYDIASPATVELRDSSSQPSSMERLIAQLKAQIEELRASQAAMSRRLEELLQGRQPQPHSLATTSTRAVPGRPEQGTVLQPTAAAAKMTGTWWFDNPNGDDEQMAIDNDDRVVVLYSNGRRDTTAIRDGTIELAEYGGAKARMWLEGGAIIQEFMSADTGQKTLKRWNRMDTRPRYEPLRPLSGPKAPVAVKIETHLVKVKLAFLEGLGLNLTSPQSVNPAAGPVVAASDALVTTQGKDQQPVHRVYRGACKIVDDRRVNQILDSARQSSDASILSSPKVMVLSGQEAMIAVGQYDPASSDSTKNASSERTPQQMRQGFQLSMTPKETGPDQTILLSFRAELIGMGLNTKQAYVSEADRIRIQSDVTIPKGKVLLVHGIHPESGSDPDKSGEILLLIRPEVVRTQSAMPDRYVEESLIPAAPSPNVEEPLLPPAPMLPTTTPYGGLLR